MSWIYLGCTSFVLLTLFDLNKIYKWHRSFNLLFPLSIILLIYALVMVLISQDHSIAFNSNPWFFTLVIIGAIEQFYALFFALPASDTYTKLDKVSVVDTGIYGLCRHPGLWGFILMAIGFSLGTGSTLVLWAAILWTAFDFIHILIQDQLIFPYSIDGYSDYQKRVPFLLFKLKEQSTCQNPS